MRERLAIGTRRFETFCVRAFVRSETPRGCSFPRRVHFFFFLEETLLAASSERESRARLHREREREREREFDLVRAQAALSSPLARASSCLRPASVFNLESPTRCARFVVTERSPLSPRSSGGALGGAAWSSSAGVGRSPRSPRSPAPGPAAGEAVARLEPLRMRTSGRRGSGLCGPLADSDGDEPDDAAPSPVRHRPRAVQTHEHAAPLPSFCTRDSLMFSRSSSLDARRLVSSSLSLSLRLDLQATRVLLREEWDGDVFARLRRRFAREKMLCEKTRCGEGSVSARFCPPRSRVPSSRRAR